MINKRGSHVGVVLSFVVFVTFLLFIFTTLEPLTQDTQKREVLLDYLEESIINEISSNLTKITVAEGETTEDILKIIAPAGDCFEENVVVKNKDNLIINSKLEVCNLFVEKSGDSSLIYSYFSPEEIIGKELGSVGVSEEVDISLYQKKLYIFESKISPFLLRANTEYDVFKRELEIPDGSEFGFAFEDSEGNIFKTNEQDVDKDVYADRIPIEYVNESASVLQGFVTIKVW
jgi:hypothetical protein